MTETGRWTFGEEPLAETRELATVLRTVAGHAVALEHPSDEVRHLTAVLHDAETRLRALLPNDLRPRIGEPDDPNRRVYLDHSRAIGDYNPCFPTYDLTCADDRAEGTVEFPLAYEGPPGVVHGGFLAVVFDCILQQLNCDLGIAGKTTGLAVRYRRPTPLLTTLRITASREVPDLGAVGAVRDQRIHSTAELRHGDELLCSAEMTAVASRRDTLPAVAPRKPA